MNKLISSLFLLAFSLGLVVCRIDPTSVSVSGLSSGAYFAVQYQVAYSSTVRGAAIFAGGPFYCAQDQLTDAFLMCMEGIEPIPLSTLENQAKQYASAGSIDPVSNLANHNVYLYSGVFDTTVKPSVVQALETMYRDLGITNVTTQYSISSAHTYPTINYGNLCALSESPYISACDYDGAGIALQSIYGTLNTPVSPVSSNYITLDQSKFTGGASPASLSLAPTAWLYVPTACKNNTAVCKLHVAFHGCQQSQSVVGNVFIENAGYNNWAEANNIIVVYPQTIVSYFDPSNAEGCWDWWGYLDANFATKQGPQMQFAKALVDYIMTNF